MPRNTSVRLVSVSAAIVLLSLTEVPASGQAPVFTKTLKKVNGVAIGSPPASLTNGDTLDWVMTYQFDHDAAQPAQTNIQDILPPTLQYVAGSLQVPPSWVKQWFDGSSWVTAEPASAKGAGAIVSPSPSGTGETSPLPAPPLVSFTTTDSGGDGYRAIPYKDQVYVVNHHIDGQYLNCFDVVTGDNVALGTPHMYRLLTEHLISATTISTKPRQANLS